MEWEYNPANYTGAEYQLIPPGEYRVRIEKAEEAVSKASGKPMIKLTLKVSGYNAKVWHYVVLDGSNAEAKARTDNNLGQIFDSFGIPIGNLKLWEWEGKVGAANIKHRADNRGTMQANVSWFISRTKQEGLPPWQEKAIGKVNPEMVNFGKEDEPIPF